MASLMTVRDTPKARVSCASLGSLAARRVTSLQDIIANGITDARNKIPSGLSWALDLLILRHSLCRQSCLVNLDGFPKIKKFQRLANSLV